jgi:ethanolamine utilization protein EutQ (cupin superfamily)
VDECLYVTEGWIKIDIHNGESYILNKGDVMVMQKGQRITFECSDDFANIAVFIDMEKRVELV